MKFLLDANLSPLISDHLEDAGHDATHVRDAGLRHATDDDIMDYARRERFVVVSQDTDFTNLLFYRRADQPSVVLLRNVQEVSALDIAGLIVDNVAQVSDALEHGAVVSLSQAGIRIRRLPLL